MLIDERGINRARFDPDLLRQHDGLASALREAVLTDASSVQPSHFLLALLKEPQGYTPAKFQQAGLKPQAAVDSLEFMLSERDQNPDSALVGASGINTGVLSERSHEAFRFLERIAGDGPCGERHLLHAILSWLEPDITEAFETFGGLEVSRLAEQVRLDYAGVSAIEIFDPEDGSIMREPFDGRGWRVTELAFREAEGYGLTKVDSLVIMLALLGIDGGLTQRGLRLQGTTPRTVHENVSLALRARRRRTEGVLKMRLPSLFESGRRVLERAAYEASRDGRTQIGEGHILRGLLHERAGAGNNILIELGVDPEALYRFAATTDDGPQDEPPEDAPPGHDVQAVIRGQIVGQDEIVDRIMPFIKRVQFGLPREGRPAGVFLFLGSTGVGKTQMSKLLAEAIYGSSEHLITIEMNQLGTHESRSILIGAPPGYIGYGEGKLTNGLRDRPNSVVLFDEVEKAHPTVLDVLLRFLDEGKIEDPAGPTRDGRHCLVVLTSNIAVTPGETGDLVAQLKQKQPFTGRPELLGRVDAILVFRDLAAEDFREIASRQLDRECRRLKEAMGIELEVEPAVCDLVAKRSGLRGQGARAVDREITDLVITPVIDLLQTPRHARVIVRLSGGSTVCEEREVPDS